MKQFKINFSNSVVNVTTKDLSAAIQILQFLGKQKFDRLVEEYTIFSTSTATKIIFGDDGFEFTLMEEGS